MRLGLELECWVVDGEGWLAAPGDLAETEPWLEREFAAPLVEVRTSPCESPAALADEFADRLDALREAAADRDLRLAPLGTPLAADTVPTRETERVRVQRAVLGDALYDAARCAGAHLHVEATAPTDQLRALTALDPALALVASAPYCRGERVATCARAQTYRDGCYGDAPALGGLWPYPASVDSWRSWRDATRAGLVDAAVAAGVDRATAEDVLSPHDAVWTPVRLRDDLGTVEWRAPDACAPDQLLRLVADVAGVLERAAERGTAVGHGPGLALPPMADLRRATREAVERGVTPDVAAHLRRVGLDPDRYRPYAARVGGGHLDDAAARRLRREAADRFERALDDLLAAPDAVTGAPRGRRDRRGGSGDRSVPR